MHLYFFFFFQAEDGIRYLVRSRGLGDVYKRQLHLAFTDDEGRCVAHFRPRPERQGCPGQLHGGIISTLLVESTQIPIHVRVLGIGFGITARRHLRIDIVGTDSSR